MTDDLGDGAAGGVVELLDHHVQVVADWPQPGVTFRDLTPVLADASALAAVLDALGGAIRALGPVDAVAGIEARGFWFAPALADRLAVGFVPIRKVGKVPGDTHRVDYQLEYGSASLEVGQSAILGGDRVVIVDDVLATGGTMAAAAQLVDTAGGHVTGGVVVLELADLGGRDCVAPLPIAALQTLGERP